MRTNQHPAEHKYFAKEFASLLANRRYKAAHRLLVEELRERITSDDLCNRFEQEFPETPRNSDEIEVFEFEHRVNEQSGYPDTIQISLDHSRLKNLYVEVVEGADNLYIQAFEFKQT
ncbi:MAG: hypothetical protein KME18_16775 [Phormidium tanganyikae FI6-MK23]|jgi:hypothetical protein|nr:hypothetical protein [Phormidium tanganyikae FI6-MK23]